ncbi:MAG TPA: nitrilase-related carbon-nitrogen hydrolase [Caulobacteraceae bacterium]|jgi:apolipoprotein N-acyltransferase
MKTLLATLAAAVLFYLSQGLNELWFFAWIAPAPLLWLAYGEERAWRVLAASFIAFLAGMAFVIQCYAPVFPPKIVAVLSLMLAPSLIVFPFTVLFARLVQRRSKAWATLLAFPLAWTAAEFLISLLSLHGVYLSFANSQIGHPLTEQTASLFGMFAITFLICLFANAIAMLARAERGGRVAAAGGLAVCALALAFGAWRLSTPQAATVRVAAITSDVSLYSNDDVHQLPGAVALAERTAAAARDAAAKGARVIVTPEGGLIAKPSWRAAVLAPLQRVADDTHALVVAGLVVIARPGDNAIPSADFAVALRATQPPLFYAKRHLLLPLEDNFTPGHAPGLIGDGYAMAVCKDMDFPRTYVADARAGDIRLMAVPSGDLKLDGWMHGRLALMRGVENGFAVVRPANEGLVLIADAYGRVVARAPSARHGLSTVIVNVAPGPGATLYTRIGDVFAWACVGLTGLLALVALLQRRRAHP